MRTLWTLRYRAIEVVLVGVGIGWLVTTNPVVDIWLLVAWDLLAFVYCTPTRPCLCRRSSSSARHRPW